MRQASMSATSANYSEAARLKGLLKQSGEEGQSEVGAGEEGQSEVGAGEEGQSAVGAREEGQSEVGCLCASLACSHGKCISMYLHVPTGELCLHAEQQHFLCGCISHWVPACLSQAQSFLPRKVLCWLCPEEEIGGAAWGGGWGGGGGASGHSAAVGGRVEGEILPGQVWIVQ